MFCSVMKEVDDKSLKRTDWSNVMVIHCRHFTQRNTVRKCAEMQVDKVKQKLEKTDAYQQWGDMPQDH